MKRSLIAISVIFLVLLIDQVLKIYVKTTFPLGGGFDILGLPWAKIHFVENEGMAFGMSFGGQYGKLFLTLFRLLAVGFIGYYLHTLVRDKANYSLIISIALVCAGAMGNIFDSIFYGVYFSESTFSHVAEVTAYGEGYTTLLHGHVVDMFYFPVASGNWPDWVPLIGGDYYHLFRSVFNIADASITIGVVSILVFQRRIFAGTQKEEHIPVADNNNTSIASEESTSENSTTE